MKLLTGIRSNSIKIKCDVDNFHFNKKNSLLLPDPIAVTNNSFNTKVYPKPLRFIVLFQYQTGSPTSQVIESLH